MTKPTRKGERFADRMAAEVAEQKRWDLLCGRSVAAIQSAAEKLGRDPVKLAEDLQDGRLADVLLTFRDAVDWANSHTPWPERLWQRMRAALSLLQGK